MATGGALIPRAIRAFFFLSGVSGLIYQIVWIRQFGLIFGNTVYSASLVTAVFMSGLGLGSVVAGRWADQLHHRNPTYPLKAYAYFELLIAAMGMAIAIVLPQLEGLSAAMSSYAPTDEGWLALSAVSVASRYALATLLLFPITALMGGTLTLVIRATIQGDDLTKAGWNIGVLYGINTLGAALGCFLVDFTLVPNLGLFATQGVAIILNLIAGLGALRIARDLEVDAVPAAKPTSASPPLQGSAATIMGAVLFSGIIGMSLEIVWFRFLSSLLGGTRAVFSLLLFVILVGIWAGSTLGGDITRRFGRPVRALMLTQAALAATSMWLIANFDIQALQQFAERLQRSESPGRAAETAYALRAIVEVVALPSVLMGFAFPLANAAIQRASAKVGQRAGTLYLANTMGAVLGSLLTGFVLLPWLGVQSVLTWLSFCALITVVLLWRSERSTAEPNLGRPALVSGLVIVVALLGWQRLAPNQLVLNTFKEVDGEIVTVSEGIGESIIVSERMLDGEPVRTLNTNGHSMSDTSPTAMRYMRAFVHVPLLMLEAPTRALVICFGVGNTAHAASLHPSLREIDVADLSSHVLAHASYFARTNGDVLKDPRLKVHVNDGRQHLRMVPDETYDLVTLEPPPIAFAGISALYSEEFYRLARSKLKKTGYLTQWLPGYQVPEGHVRAAVGAFVKVFPEAVLLAGTTQELIMIGGPDGAPTVDPRLMLERATQRGVIQDLERIHLATPVEIAGMFLADSESMRRSSQGVASITDDFPIMEYGVITFTRTHFPPDLVDLSKVSGWCPSCFDESAELATGYEDLNAYLAVLGHYYTTDAFLSSAGNEARLRLLPRDDPAMVDAFRASAFLRSTFRRLSEP